MPGDSESEILPCSGSSRSRCQFNLPGSRERVSLCLVSYGPPATQMEVVRGIGSRARAEAQPSLQAAAQSSRDGCAPRVSRAATLAAVRHRKPTVGTVSMSECSHPDAPATSHADYSIGLRGKPSASAVDHRQCALSWPQGDRECARPEHPRLGSECVLRLMHTVFLALNVM